MPNFDIKIKPVENAHDLSSAEGEEQKPVQATVDLKIRKTLDGSFVVFDHPEIDIVIMPQMLKVVFFSEGRHG